jgi:hypothetical protein
MTDDGDCGAVDGMRIVSRKFGMRRIFLSKGEGIRGGWRNSLDGSFIICTSSQMLLERSSQGG